MPRVLELEGKDYNVVVLVDDEPPIRGASRDASTTGGRLAGMLEAKLPIDAVTKIVAQLAESFSEALAQNDHRPANVEVSFGLEASGELGNFLISKIAGKTNFGVKMTWKFD